MDEGVWEPLFELTLYPCNHGSSVYCLCSRALLTSIDKCCGEFYEEKQEGTPDEEHLAHSTPFHFDVPPLVPLAKKLELEAASCYCSASHYSTDDYDSVMMSATAEIPPKSSSSNKEPMPCPLQNSDSGADLSEHFPEALRSNPTEPTDSPQLQPSTSVQTSYEDHRSVLTVHWERFWALHGESIIWRSWIEKYGAYVNPSYGEISVVVPEVEKVKPPEVPDVRVSSVDEGDEEQVVRAKSNSFGSSTGYEKLRTGRARSRCSNASISGKSVANTLITTDSLTNVTKITLSSLDLSGESENGSGSSAISSSSPSSDLDTSRSSSESGHDESGRENDIWWRRVWKEHYDSAYQASFVKFQDNFNSQLTPEEPESPGDGASALEAAKAQLIQKFCCGAPEVRSIDQPEFLQQRFGEINCEATEEAAEERVRLLGKFGAKERRENSFRAWSYVNSVGFILQRLHDTSLTASDGVGEPVDGLETVNEKQTSSPTKESNSTNISHSTPVSSHKRSFDEDRDDDEEDDRPRKLAVKKSSHETDSASAGKVPRVLEKVKAAMLLASIPFQPTDEEGGGFRAGYVNYRKKNIRAQNRRLKLSERTHLWFDEGGEERKVTTLVEVVPTPMDLPVEEPEALGYEAHSSSADDVDDLQDTTGESSSGGKKQKKKKKKLKKYIENVPSEILENKKELFKYWRQRYRLFLKYDKGIRLDRESWFSVTPEKVSTHQAQRCRCDLIIDGFCGAGGNAIQFAFTCERVIAIDIDPEKIALARHNAEVYGVADRIEFVVGDFLALAPRLKADVVFLSPPWGGPSYQAKGVFPVSSILPPIGGQQLYNIANEISSDVALFLPRNINSYELSLLPGEGGAVELEQNFLDRKLIGVTAYFGSLILDPDNPSLDADELNC